MFVERGSVRLMGSLGKPMEDDYAVRVDERFGLYAVIDGVSGITGSLENFPLDGGSELVSGGTWAAQQIRAFLRSELDFTKVGSALEVAELADRYFRRRLVELELGHEDAWTLPGAALSIAFTDRKRNHYSMAQVGDCMAAVQDITGTIRHFDDPLMQLDARVYRAFRKKGNRLGHYKVQLLLKKHRIMRNSEHYAVVDGKLNPALVAKIELPLDQVAAFALWSDGLYFLNSDLRQVSEAILKEGIQSWADHVNECEAGDPHFKTRHRLKNDDKTGIAFVRV